MEQELLNIFNECGIEKYTFSLIMLGFLISILYEIIISVCTFIREQAWLVGDYEKIIYYSFFDISIDDVEKVMKACSNYESYLKRKDKRDKIKRKFLGKEK